MSSSSLLVAIIRPVRCNSEFCSWLLWELEYSLLSTQRESRELHVATTRSTVKEAHCCDVEKANPAALPADLRASLCRFLLHHDDVHVQASRSTNRNHQPIHVSVSNHATEPCTRPSRPSPYRTVQQPSVEGRGAVQRHPNYACRVWYPQHQSRPGSLCSHCLPLPPPKAPVRSSAGHR